ncbi:MAG: Transposase IS4 family protein [Desulfotomaculum sp. 46_296]|nr:MAG: Transposase IS4 family protein [Desulfotomaculum sp. 46_296]
MVCFLALVLESALQRKIKEKGLDLEYTYLLRDLAQLKAVELNIDEEKYLCRTELVGNTYEAFKVLDIRPPMQIAPLGRKAKLKDDNLTLF